MKEALAFVESNRADIVLVREKRKIHKILVRIPIVADTLKKKSPYEPIDLLRGYWVFRYKKGRGKPPVMLVLLEVLGRDNIRYVEEDT